MLPSHSPGLLIPVLLAAFVVGTAVSTPPVHQVWHKGNRGGVTAGVVLGVELPAGMQSEALLALVVYVKLLVVGMQQEGAW